MDCRLDPSSALAGFALATANLKVLEKKAGEEKERRREKNKPRPLRLQGRPVGRNERCPCGSGKKYKKCKCFAEARAAERLRRIQGGESLEAVYHDPRFPQATNYLLAFECDRAEVADAYLALTREQGEPDGQVNERLAIARECLRQLWQNLDASGRSMGRSQDAVWLETAMELIPYDDRYCNLADRNPVEFDRRCRDERWKVGQETLAKRDAALNITPAPEREGA